MTSDGKRGSAPESESGSLRGGRPIDPQRRDADPHPTKEAERRSEKVRSGEPMDKDPHER